MILCPSYKETMIVGSAQSPIEAAALLSVEYEKRQAHRKKYHIVRLHKGILSKIYHSGDSAYADECLEKRIAEWVLALPCRNAGND